MSVKLRTKRPDAILKKISGVLEKYSTANPKAEIEAYRQNAVSVRVRIISPDFQGKSRADREDEVWSFFDELSDQEIAEISLLLLLTPEEAKKSFANFEFDNPIPTKL